MNSCQLAITHIGGPTGLLEFGGLFSPAHHLALQETNRAEDSMPRLGCPDLKAKHNSR